MEQKTENYLRMIERKFESDSVGVAEFESLLKEWGQFVSNTCYEGPNVKQTYLNLNCLKLSVKWFMELDCLNKSQALQNFIQAMIKYVCVELEGLNIYPELDNVQQIEEKSKTRQFKWTASTRSLIELISALGEAKCINKGDITTENILSYFHDIFGVNLDNYHTELNKMANRKPKKDNDQRAYFLSGLAEKFNQKMLAS
ncbi:RteC domain-containing protein [Saccharicrinis aurantiacus]|uniref:RteC domain-containing protein n=1 Tax=Saccharicrinis aurantiacus TaxID=1849719 RepID=UPI00094F8F90|nr:RteC domain-containing protein [Saccharicrinis aurantiacus]